MSELVDAKELSRRLRVTPATIHAWHRRGWIPGLRASRRPVLFDVEAVARAMRQRAGWKGAPMSARSPERLLLTAREAAAALSVSPRTLWTLTASRDVPHIRLGCSVRYPTDVLQRWIEAKQKGGEPK